MTQSLTKTAEEVFLERFEEMLCHEETLADPNALSYDKMDAYLGIIDLHRKNGCYLQAEENILRAEAFSIENRTFDNQDAELETHKSELKVRRRGAGSLYGGPSCAQSGKVFGHLDVTKEAASLKNWVSVYDPAA